MSWDFILQKMILEHLKILHLKIVDKIFLDCIRMEMVKCVQSSIPVHTEALELCSQMERPCSCPKSLEDMGDPHGPNQVMPSKLH